MTNYATGHNAEQKAAEYLKTQGYKILETNWQTPYCEIDIVAQRKKRVYFVEVKYRKSKAFGTGLEYITSKKLKQMKFAAEMWISQHNWKDDCQLAAIEMSGDDEVVEFLTDL